MLDYIFDDRAFVQNRYIYSLGATKRILDLPQDHKVRITYLKKVVWVHAEGFRPTFISKKTYLKHFAQFRKDNSHKLHLERTNVYYWQVNSQSSDAVYNVSIHPEHMSCSCSDYRRIQKEYLQLKQPCCKHMYAVLNRLGHSSLREYLAGKEKIAA